jgi:hypothetical protein
MNSALGRHNVASKVGPEYQEEYRAKVNRYVAKQHPIVRGLHRVLQGLSLLLLANAVIWFGIALYQSFLWAISGSLSSLGAASYLPDAWVNFGLSMSLMVFPWGLDSMLMRYFPAVPFPLAWYRFNKPIPFNVGPSYFFAGFGIMCAGAPGVAHFIGLASQALQRLF